MDQPPLVCPVCRMKLARQGSELRCDHCGRRHAVVNGIPHLLVRSGDGVEAQSRWFDEAVMEEWEITRPHDAPALHGRLLGEKFQRGVEGLDLIGLSALSVCAGSGMDAEFLARAGAHVTAVDVSARAAARTAERARRYGIQMQPIVADATRLPFPDRSFDLVFVHDGLHHLDRPTEGLREMARVSRHAVSVSEPASAAVTRFAVRARLAREYEEAGNRVARLDPREVALLLRQEGFGIVRAERYAMFYRHQPGHVIGLLSRRPLLQLAMTCLRAANALAGRWGNKLVVVAVRE
jgi:SAM-dependent methyltransferase